MSGADDLASKGFADRLMSQADAENGNSAREMADQVDADARLMGSAGAGGDDDPFRVHLFDLVHRNLIVAADLNLGAHFAYVLDQVVSERIVIVEDENHA